MEDEQCYGIYSLIKKFMKKIAKEYNNIGFLKDCRYFGITPKFIKIKNWYIDKEFRREAKFFEVKIMNKIIRKKYGAIKRMENEVDILKQELRNGVKREKYEELTEKIDWFTERETERQKRGHNKKLKYWIAKYRIDVKTMTEKIEIPYINRSKFIPSTTQDQLLKLGPKFVIEQPIDLKDTVAKIETAIEKLPGETRLECRLTAAKELRMKIKENKNNNFEIMELKKIKNNPDIKCIQTDKTGKIAILDKNEYIDLMEEAIHNLNVDILKNDPVNQIIRKVENIIKNKNWPNEEKPTKNSAPITPRIFGKLKDHKEPIKIRPIVNKIEGPTYPLEKYMKRIYQNLLPPSNNSINSTQELIRSIKDIKMKENEKIISLDIKDMYPSIDIFEMEQIIEEKIKIHYSNEIEIQNTLISATNLLLRSSIFQFNGTYYKQKNGLPMGSPISGVLAEMKLRDLEEIIIKELRNNITLWIRYVDDVLAIIKNIEPNKLLEILNKYDDNIKFTCEIEKNEKINYLDVTILRKSNGYLDTTVYRKPTANINIINIKSHSPFRYKTAVITAYINRALQVCSSELQLGKEIELIEKIAQKAGYKKNFIRKIFKKRKKKLEIISNAQKQSQKYTTAIPYNKGVGETIRSIAAKNNCQIPVKPDKNIWQIIKNDKDKIDAKETAGIYQIDYINKKSGIKGSYIGVTQRKIKTRIKEHRSDIEHNRQKAAITTLEDMEDIEIDFNGTKKLANYDNHGCAYKREAIEIWTCKNTCNKMDHADVPVLWKNLFSRSGGLGPSSKAEIRTPEDDKE